LRNNIAYTDFLNQLLKQPFNIGVTYLGKNFDEEKIFMENKEQNQKKERTNVNLLNFMIPDIELSPACAKNDRCNNCNDNSNLEYHNTGAWTDLYTCYNCGHLNYIIYSDKMGGCTSDTVKLFKIHPTAKQIK
jgi:hypothetical protein